MQIRLLSCLAGGCLGAAASSLSGGFGLSPTLAMIVFSSLGVAAGYMVSVVFDAFSTDTEEEGAESQN